MSIELSEVTYEQTPEHGVVFSEYANLFPMMEGADREKMMADISTNGVRSPVVFLGEQILDGRNRYTIARELGQTYPRCEYIGTDPLGFVISSNLNRRHLTESQRAMVAAKLAKLPSGVRPGTGISVGAVTQSDAATMLNVSVDSIQSARKVQEQAIPEIVAKVEAGEVSVSAAASVATLPVEQQVEIIRSADPKAFSKVAKEVRAKQQQAKKDRRVEREVTLAEKQRALPDAKFGVVYADPAWRYETYSAETGMDRSADNHYPTAVTDEICALPVGDIAADDCVLFLWSTVPMLPDALRVMAAWGFTYKSNACWYKIREGEARGTGYWFTNEHEILLVGTKGNIPAPAPGTQWLSVIEAPIGRHSEKPEIFAEMIEEYFPNLPKCELNHRGAPRKGWVCWGNESEEIAA